MPTYEYKCQCGHGYEEFRTITQGHPKKCPKCGVKYGEGFEQNFSAYNVTAIVRGNPTTIGQQAELNAKRVGKEQMQLMAEEASNRTAKFTGKLPDNAMSVRERHERTAATTPWFRDGSVPGVPKLEKPLDLSSVKDTKAYIETGKK